MVNVEGMTMTTKRERNIPITRKGDEKLARLAYLLNCTKKDAADLAIRTLYEREVYHRDFRQFNKSLALHRVLPICGVGGRKALPEP